LQGKEEWWGKDKVVVVVVEVRGMVAHNLISSAFFFINYYNRNKYIYIYISPKTALLFIEAMFCEKKSTFSSCSLKFLRIFFVNVELRYFFFLILSSDNNFIQYKTLFFFIFFL
jgi:hypothetical protein